MRGGAGAEERTGLAWFCPAAGGSIDSGGNRGPNAFARILVMKKLSAKLVVRVALLAAFGLLVVHAMAAEVPAKPTHYFNDHASLIDPGTAQQLEQRLEDFER